MGKSREKKILKEFFKKVLKFLKLCCIIVVETEENTLWWKMITRYVKLLF